MLSDQKLPAGWQDVTLGSIAAFKAGRTPARDQLRYWQPSPASIPWVSIADMRRHETITSTREQITPDALDEVFGGQRVPAGTLLMSFKLTIGRVATLGIDACHNEAIVAIYPRPDVLQKYLEYFLSQVDYTAYQDRAVKGNTLNREKLERVRVLLPPLEEQARIAAVLDLMRDVIRTHERKGAVLVELFDALLHGFTTGEISADALDLNEFDLVRATSRRSA